MKRKITRAVILIVLMIIFIRPFPVKQVSQPRDVSLSDTTSSGLRIQAEEPMESPSSATHKPVSGERRHLSSSPVAEQPLAVAITAKTESPALATEEKIDNAKRDETNIPSPAEEEILSIVMIAVCETEETAAQPASSAQDLSGVKGFRILGNPDETPLDLIVESRDAQGCEKIHFLDWNRQHPNEFKLYGALGCDTSVGIFANKIQVARFSVPEGSREEYIALDLNKNLELAYAQ